MENSIFSLQLGICNANCMHCSTPLYIRDLNILRSGDPWGPWSQSPSPNPMDTEGLYEGGPPKTWNLFIKNCVCILTCLNFSHLQSTLCLMQYTYQDDFSTAHKLLNMSILMPFSVSAVFSHLFHISKMFPFEYFFIQGNKRNCSE